MKDREEITDIITDYSNLSRNEADNIAGMIVSAGFSRTKTAAVDPETQAAFDKVLFYAFDGEDYAPTEAGRQRLLEDIKTALDTEAITDPNVGEDEVEVTVQAAFANTSMGADFWDNLHAISRDAPYEISVKRVTLGLSTREERERAQWAY